MWLHGEVDLGYLTNQIQELCGEVCKQLSLETERRREVKEEWARIEAEKEKIRREWLKVKEMKETILGSVQALQESPKYSPPPQLEMEISRYARTEPAPQVAPPPPTHRDVPLDEDDAEPLSIRRIRKQSAKITLKIYRGIPTCLGKKMEITSGIPLKKITEAAANHFSLPSNSKLYHANGLPLTNTREIIRGGSYLMLPRSTPYSEEIIPTSLLEGLIDSGIRWGDTTSVTPFT